MKKYIFVLLALLFISYSYAEGGHSTRKSDPNYKNLKVYAKVLKRYGKSNYYQAQVDIVNTGKKTVSFWEDTSTYNWTFSFTAGQIWTVSNLERECFEKGITYKPSKNEVYKKVMILPHAKHTQKIDFFIGDKGIFLKSNKNLRLTFHFNDANLAFWEDESHPRIISENTLDYEW